MVFFTVMFLLLLQPLFLTSALALVGHHYPPHRSLLTDRAALLAFKRTITHDPNSILANWDEGVDVCNFTGVLCDKHRVIKLHLQETQLVGLLSPFISNLTGLHVLELGDNQFFGIIPPEFSSLRRLHRLWLMGNNLHGSIPDSFAFLSKLTVISLAHNNLTGVLPPSLFANSTKLEYVDLFSNFLTGKIPDEVGNCPNLWNINFFNNQFTGELPFSLTNASFLYNIDVGNNNLSGELPVGIVQKLPKLRYLHLSYNRMESHDNNTNLDPFFTALANCTILEELELGHNGLGGRLPNSIGRLGVKLKTLYMQENQIFGSIPPSIANLSSLTELNLTSNILNGKLSAEISHLSQLEQLFLSQNLFTSAIPPAIGQYSHLGLLDLSNNKFSGPIPESIGNLGQVKFLFLNNNHLLGRIPATLGQCTNLYELDLSHNRLTGSIPPEISGIPEIRIFLNLSHNHLEGPLPIELSKLINIQEIDLSSNNLTGSIFSQISNCIALRTINFSHNSLEGDLSDSLGDLENLEVFDVSGNHLSGSIPKSLSKIHTLTFLNLSFNNFVGIIPSGGIFNSVTNMSFLGNPKLCGKAYGMSSCPSNGDWFHKLFHRPVRLVIFILVIFVSAFFLTIYCVFGFRCIGVTIPSWRTETVRRPTTPDLPYNFPRLTHKELLEATGGFEAERIIGSGSYGRVYKGVLADGTAIAVKVLQVQNGNSTKSFNRECQVLKRIRHRNLIRIITACSLPDFKALVLPYMANGSLDSHLYPHSETGLDSGSSDLSLIQRLNICRDVAEGMAYLHHHSPVKVIHCDLKPSNVLLNDDMTAVVSDFGIARLVMAAGAGNSGVENLGNSTANMLRGSVGYIAPEYGFGSNISTKGDVYSFGILVLEMVTRKRPTDDMFVGGLSLHKWVKSHYHGRVEKVVDSSLVRASRDQSTEVKKMWEVTIGELIELGILCTQESPSTRPTMLDAADDLDRLKRYLSGDTTATFASSLGISSSMGND